MLAVSRLNYPGADALNRLHDLASNDTGVMKVHMDTLACMTGVTRFMEKKPPSPLLDDMDTAGDAFWIYDKTEDEQKLLDPLFWEGFDYALAERPERVIGRWQVLETVYGFAGLGIARPGEEIVRGGTIIDLRSFGKLRRDWQTSIWELWDVGVVNPLRQYVTRGLWFKMKLEPKIRILKKEKGPFLVEPGMDNEPS